MKITENYITKGTINRPGTRLKAVKGIVVHWIGAAQPKAIVIRNNFNNGGRVGSAQFIIDYETGEIIQTMPANERAQHVGADTYTPLKNAICGKDNPNNFLIGIECCIKAGTVIPADYSSKTKYLDLGKPSEVQYRNLIEFLAKMCKDYKLNPLTQIYRHYDITGKACHVYYYKHNDLWEQLKRDVLTKMQEGEEEVEIKSVKVEMNGIQTEIPSINYQGENYMKIRSLADADKGDKLEVGYDSKRKVVVINSK